jgi:thioredoxin-related protein
MQNTGLDRREKIGALTRRLLFPIFVIAICFSTVSARADNALAWGGDLTNALQTAKANHRPVLLQFNAPWCPYCRQMESKVFKDPAVATALEQFERVAVNIDINAPLAAQHAVRGIPAFVMLDSDGDEAAKTSGFMEAEPFNQWLLASRTNLTASAAQKEEFEKQSHAMEKALADPDPITRAKGLVMALDWCERSEKMYRTFGTAQLAALAKTNPQLLLEGMKHPALMARIRVANLLREKFGDGFNIDPWEKAETRLAGIQEWQGKIAAKAH